MGLGAVRDTDREILIRLEGKIDVMMVRHETHAADIVGLKADVKKLNEERQQRIGMTALVRTLWGFGGVIVGVVVALMIRIQH